MNAPITVELDGETDPLVIAEKELYAKTIPLIIRRYGTYVLGNNVVAFIRRFSFQGCECTKWVRECGKYDLITCAGTCLTEAMKIGLLTSSLSRIEP